MEPFCPFLVSVCGYVHLNAVALRGQKRAVDPLELESRVVLSNLTWVPRTRLWSSAEAESAPQPSHFSVLGIHLSSHQEIHLFKSGRHLGLGGQ